MKLLNQINKTHCSCKKEHIFESEVITGKGAINRLPEAIKKFNAKKVFIIADKNTFSVAGESICLMLTDSGTDFCSYVYDKDILDPDEKNTGLAFMHYSPDCNLILAIGSGVINDISKIVSAVTGNPYIIVATAPSMDGYASATSSMTVEGLKISLDSKCADVIIGDTDILCTAPVKMMLSGLGDMLAKYVSICEWRISKLITGEYYCEDIARLVRLSLKKCTDNAEGLLLRDENAVEAVFEGLVICGAAMKFAGISRPASGIEHYLSHIWDMRGAEFKTPVELHGIQCALGTLIAITLYEKIINISPNKQKALEYVKSFDYSAWSKELRTFLGKGAEAMIALEMKENKYSPKKHKKRLDIIIEKWDDIVKIIKEELPSSADMNAMYKRIGLPVELNEIGIDASILPMTFNAAKDIRDKYVLPRLCWDLGIIDEIF